MEQADELVLYSLHPGHEAAEAAKQEEKFHGWKRLGQTTLDGEEAIEPLFTAFKKGVNENDDRVAGCFNPRHGIKVMHGEDRHEFVICFECFQVQWIVNDKKQKGFLRLSTRLAWRAALPAPSAH